MRVRISLLLLILLSVFVGISVGTKCYAHCEIPCGIYHDKMRIEMLREHIETIEKSIKEITKLSQENSKNYNQLVRWINNKDDHAIFIQEVVSQYFLTQRIKPISESGSAEYKDYVKKLTILHEMLIYAMKAKQTTDLANVEKLKSLVDEFEKLYFKDEKKHEHK